jgi:peptidyl-prolyl cis-trans isomerase-like protein 2
MPYLMKHKADPVTGLPMSSKDLVTLHMDRNEETGKWQCPVLNKPFLNHTKIVAIMQRDGVNANVYSYEAVHELCYKSKSYVDLISGEKFNKKTDVIVLQDANNPELSTLRDINHFKHTSALRQQNSDANEGNNGVRLSVTASRIMDKMKRKREEEEKEQQKKNQKKSISDGHKVKIFTNDLTGVSMTSGKASGSLTSTAMSVTNHNDAREATEEEILQAHFAAMKQMKRKGFVRFHTNLGIIDLELHCDIVPKTCMNFLGLCEKGSYDGTKFHRSIRNFMVQGGKATSASEKGKSIWGGAFEDEFDDRLKHSGEGILAMANSGANTNARQFYITYKSAPHLDRKHSVFGRIVKGIDVLHSIEDVPTDKKDRPCREIKLERAEVLYSPVEDAAEKERVRIQKRSELRRLEKEERRALALGKTIPNVAAAATQPDKTLDQEIGRYLPKPSKSSKKVKKKKDQEDAVALEQSSSPSFVSRLPPPPKKTTFGDFDGW